MRNTIILCFTALCLIGCKDSTSNRQNNTNEKGSREFIPEPDANPELSTAEVIAYKNRLDLWEKVEKIAFTFNVDRGENHFERSFIWKPKTHDVTYITSNDTVQYNRLKPMDSIQLRADQAFINDKYWLLAPYQLVWDEGTSFTEGDNEVAPISKDTLNRLTILYGDEGGYTPGDAYDLYFGKDFMIKEWVFREKNTPEASMITTWEAYEDYNGLKIATMHKDSTGNFKLYFTNILVQ